MQSPVAPNNLMTPARVGVFDSGVGGLSVLRELRDQLPRAALHYVADAGHAPYGERSDQHVVERSRRVASHLINGGAQLIVIACNTATAVAGQLLREAWPQMPIVGVEPGIKPALLATRNGRVGVMATRATLGSEKFKRLAAALATAEALHLRACDGLAAAIEQGQFDTPGMLALVETHCAPCASMVSTRWCSAARTTASFAS
jgi:glutamate racemase